MRFTVSDKYMSFGYFFLLKRIEFVWFDGSGCNLLLLTLTLPFI